VKKQYNVAAVLDTQEERAYQQDSLIKNFYADKKQEYL